jgi:rsbT co-antagonist protein RsbR
LRSTIRRVKSGDFSELAEVRLPEDHPLTILALGVNEMARSLQEARSQIENRLAQIEQEAERIEAQKMAIRELSTPVIELWRGILCIPIVGVVDTDRAAETTQRLLDEVMRRSASYVILDITGVEVMDTGTSSHFLRLAAAVELLGAECAISGFSPSVAGTVVQMGMDLSRIRTFRTIREALQHRLNQRATSLTRQGGPA